MNSGVRLTGGDGGIRTHDRVSIKSITYDFDDTKSPILSPNYSADRDGQIRIFPNSIRGR